MTKEEYEQRIKELEQEILYLQNQIITDTTIFDNHVNSYENEIENKNDLLRQIKSAKSLEDFQTVQNELGNI